MKKIIKHVCDAYEVGDLYDDGDLKGKIEQIITAEDGTRTVVVETTNDDGDVESVEVGIEDSSDKDKFFMDLLLKKEAICPVSGKWEIKGDKVYNKGKEVAEVAEDVETTINNIESAFDKVTDAREFTKYAEVDDKYVDDLFDDGIAIIPLNTEDPDKLFDAFDNIVQEYAGPDGNIDLGWDLEPDGKAIRVWVDFDSM